MLSSKVFTLMTSSFLFSCFSICSMVRSSPLLTMVIQETALSSVVLKNNYLGMVREFQHYTYKDSYSVVDLSGSPDLEKLTSAYGMDFLRLENMDKAEETIGRRLKSGLPLPHDIRRTKSGSGPHEPARFNYK